MPDIFLSYSRDDQVIARRFAEGFERAGFSVWWDATLNPGEAYDEVTEKALNEAKAVVVLWSKKSVASRWVRAEATQANDNKTLVPVMIEPCKRPIMFELTHTADLTHWSGDKNDKAWLAYVAGVRLFVERGEPVSISKAGGAASMHQHQLSAHKQHPIIIAATAVLTLTLVFFVADKFWFGKQVMAEPATAATAAITDKSIAVLPLDDFSAKGDEAYFTDGLTEEILTALSRTPDLLVASRTSSFQYKGKMVDIKQVAKELNVAHILEGSVRRTSDRLRVTVQLIRAADGFHLWSENYDRKPDDLIAVQEDIAFQIAIALKTAMDPVALKQMVQAGTSSVAAYNLYLQGIGLAHELGGGLSRETYEKFEQARQIDPGFAGAHAHSAAYWRGQLEPSLMRSEMSTQESLSPTRMLALHQERIQLAVSTAKAPDQLLYRMQQAKVKLQLKAAFGYAEQYLNANPSLNNLDTTNGGPAMAIVQLMYLFDKKEAALALMKKLSTPRIANVYDAGGLVNNFFYVDDLATGRDYALAMVERFPLNEQLLYQTHRLLISAGHVEEARKVMEKVRGTDLQTDNINLMRLRQACAEADLNTANQLLGTFRVEDLVGKWQALHIMGRAQEAAAQVRSLDQPDTLYSLSSLMVYPFFDINQYPNLKAMLERDGVPLPVYKPIPYACKAKASL